MFRDHLRRRRMLGSPPGAPAPFVVGVGRSGTTLLRMMLDSHPEMAIPPETHFLPPMIDGFTRLRVTPERILETIKKAPQSGWPESGVDADALLERLREIKPPNAPDSIRAFYRLYAEGAGKARWGDKTPRYVTSLAKIGRAVPEARFVHMIRDGRDVALSTNKRLVELRGSRPVPPERMAKRWRHRILSARRVEQIQDRYMEIRYEDLVLDTQPTLRAVCDFVKLDYDPVMLDYHERAADRLQEMNRERERGSRRTLSGEERMQAHAMTTKPPQAERVEVWKTEMDDAYRREFELYAGELLAELSYEVKSPSEVPAGSSGLPS